MSTLRFLIISLFFIFSNIAISSEALDAGKISALSIRGGYVTFKVLDENKVNLCSACPTDPGLRGSQSCWIADTETVQISMLLSAQSRNKKVEGRVIDFAKNCNVYQMTIQD